MVSRKNARHFCLKMNEALRYNSYRRYIKSKFGMPVLKVPLNGGFSCPNRDGSKSFSGCVFCDNRAFSPAAQKCDSSLKQLCDIIQRFQGRFNAFIAYLQPFTNTYGNIEKLRSVYEPLLSVPQVVGLAIGTRPDCFSKEIFEYLDELSERTYLSIELGLQSVHQETLDKINRGHTFSDFCNTVERLKLSGIETVAHVMLGLPGETGEMMIETAKKLSQLPVSGVKIHQLMVIEATELENWYKNKLVEPLELQRYVDILCKFISFLRPDQHIHRLLADSKKEYGLIAPLWSEQKHQSLSKIYSYMEKNNVKQGSNFKS